MALSDRAYVRVPPDGAGKALVTDHIRHIEYNGASSAAPFALNDLVTATASGITVRVLHLVPGTATTGAIGVDVEFVDLDTDFVVGENLQVDGVTLAQVTVAEDLYVSKTELVGGNNPLHAQFIDKKGAASVRFSEGSTQFDAFGRTQVSQARVLGSYSHTYDSRDNRYSDVLVGDGARTYDPVTGSVVLSVGTASGALARRITNRYHKYQLGVSQLIMMTVLTGDNGKAGLASRWGYFDTSDGLFFQQTEAGLAVALRSSTTGSVVTTVVPQADWNGDKLDGTGLSLVDLDATLNNLYWIDFAWLGAGRARMGIFAPNGERITCHTFHNGNADPRPWARTGSLPVSWELENLGATGSSSELRIFNAVVKTESGSLVNQPDTFTFSDVSVRRTVDDLAYWPLLSIRPKMTFVGRTNRTIIAPFRLSVDAGSLDLLTDVDVVVQIVQNATLTAPAWVSVAADSTVESDSSATASSGGKVISEWFVRGNANLDLSALFGIFTEFLLNTANGDYSVYTVQARALRSVDASALASLTWNEVRD